MLALLYNWRIRVCRRCYRIFHGKGKECEGCREKRKAVTQDRDRFRNLLDQHKHLYPQHEKVYRQYLSDLKSGRDLQRIMRDYAVFCKKHNLRTAWIKKYLGE